MRFKLPILLFTLLFQSLLVFAGPVDQFITIWQTNNAGASNANEIQFFGTGNGYTIMWEEVGNEIANNGTLMAGTIAPGSYQLITFPTSGTYKVRVDPTTSGTFTAFRLVDDKLKLVEVAQWGSTAWSGFYQAFRSCINLNVTATDAPVLSQATTLSQMFAFCSNLVGNSAFNTWQTATITDMSGMFWSATLFNQALNNWNTSNVTNMFNMFQNAINFNANISGWNTGSVTNMGSMFRSASSFNQPIGSWTTSSVTNMTDMFRQATLFNQPLNTWNTGSVTNTEGMFQSASSFNQPIGSWTTSSITNMANMFLEATLFNQPLNTWVTSSVTNMTSLFEASAFNQPIGTWDVSSVTNMNGMFNQASSFNEDLSAWDLSSISSMLWMFDNCGMDCINYSLLLNGWAANVNTPNSIALGAMGMIYDNTALAAHTALATTKSWTISGDTYDGGCGVALPVTLRSFKGVYNAPFAVLNWESATEQGLNYYSVEQSADGINFRTIGNIPATGSGSNYSLNHLQPETRSFYRLQMVDLDGKISYSTTQRVGHNETAHATSTIYPNPVQDGQLRIKATNPGKVLFFNSLGQQVMTVTIDEGTQVIDVRALSNGLYWIKLDGTTQRLIIAR